MSVRLSLWDWPNIQHLGFVSTNNMMADGLTPTSICIIFLSNGLFEKKKSLYPMSTLRF